MIYINTFESFQKASVLIIIDVQKSFSKFYTDNYLKQLNNYCKSFDKVYQVWDNHVEGTNVDKDYLYDKDPDVELNDDLYKFPNQVEKIEKRYNYDVDADFYKNILDIKTYKEIKSKEADNSLKRGDVFKTKEETYLIYIGNNHKWYHVGKKLQDIFLELSGKEVIMVGGSDQECFLDVETAAKSFGVRVKRNPKYIYSATKCPIK